MADMNCPKCGEECARDEADVGVGVIYGPWGCYYCGWSESSEYDCSQGPSVAQQEHPEFYVDQCGGMQRLSAIEDKLNHFGLNGKSITDEVFRVNGE